MGSPTTTTAAAGESSNPKPISIMFVCLGNICRSPMAEAVFAALTQPSPWAHSPSSPHPLISTIASAGTGAYHVGDAPDPRTTRTLHAHGITTYTHQAQQLVPAHLRQFDYVLAMDAENLAAIRRMRRQVVAQRGGDEKGVAKVGLWGRFGGRDLREEVGDPYYGAADGFEVAFEQMVRFSRGFLRWLEEGGEERERVEREMV